MSEQNNFTPDMKSYKPLSPFKLFVKSNFPFIEATYEALDNYGLYCKIVEYLNTVMANENIVEENVASLYDAFVKLNDYVSNFFDNLDVQDEINNKLDAMTEAGYFDNLITNYLKLIRVYDTCSDMLLDYENLVVGMKIKTLGYYTMNDGGQAEYIIKETAPSGYYETVGTLYAELIEHSEANVKRYGAYGDGIHDDTTVIQDCLNKNENGTVYFPSGEYLITTTLNFKCNLRLEQNSRIITTNSSIGYLLKFNCVTPAESINELVKGRVISGGILDGKGIAANLLGVASYMGLTIKNMRFENPKSFGLVTRVNGNLSAELHVLDCYFYNNYSLYPNKPVGIFNNGSDNIFSHITMYNMHVGIHSYSGYFEYIHPWIDNKNLLADSIAFKMNGNVSMIGCVADTYEKGFNLLNVHNYRLINCNVFYNTAVYDQIAQARLPYIFYCESNNVNIFTDNLQINNNIDGAYFINRITKGSFINTIFTGEEEVDKTNYVKDSFKNEIQSLVANTDVQSLDSGCYSIQNVSLINFIPNLSNYYGQLVVFKNRTFTVLIFYQHNSNEDVYFCVGANGGTWRSWRKCADSTEITEDI